jgi:hypothetical protein
VFHLDVDASAEWRGHFTGQPYVIAQLFEHELHPTDSQHRKVRRASGIQNLESEQIGIEHQTVIEVANDKFGNRRWPKFVIESGIDLASESCDGSVVAR